MYRAKLLKERKDMTLQSDKLWEISRLMALVLVALTINHIRHRECQERSLMYHSQAIFSSQKLLLP